jgi:hypothetical protein
VRAEILRRGFAAPVTVLFILLLTAGFVTLVSRISGQVRELDRFRIETQAFALAQGGLEHYFAGVHALVDDTTMMLGGGSARLHATLIRPPQHNADSALYIVRSDGVVAGRGAQLAEGRRTVSQLAYRIEHAGDGQPRWSVISNAWMDQR